ncbi:MAG: hypothetical protein GY943_19050 [Chloroflexi bacterium]|nr:hypothetical protein [Chloroflexota bacterium]
MNKNHNQPNSGGAKKSAAIVTGIFILIVAIISIMLHQSSPGPDGQEILGVSIGAYEGESGIAHISGRALDCQPTDADNEFNSACQIEIHGKQLTIFASRNGTDHSMQLGGTCTAVYDSSPLNCHIGSRHVHMHWFAFINQPENFSATDMDILRMQYFFENLSEIFYVRFVFIVATMIAILVMWNGWVWIRPYLQKKKVFAVAAILPIGFVSFYISLMTLAVVTSGFWD